ncbi:GTP:AMP phosphotransferase AK3-like protein [Dinothrombium tinctorium]|uniref:GTP:AMP phosphotransferase, mitochondrial n=1 Tax=Dinothrombium tinctorium TaxID=1965070 RepID=A0A443RGU8_9ACAR|nr:GTP:AMP phosphotransferase AK3-like protein [Dinothrombium tinctorium]
MHILTMSTGRLIRLVILGAPGSGKGTISTKIVRDFKLDYICCGDILRNQIEAKSEYGLIAKKYISDGNLVPNEVVTKLTLDEIKAKHFNKSWLLDGFPRTVKQAESLSKFATINQVINLDVPHEVILNRIRGRLIHVPSGRVYNLDYNPPKTPGIDDITGEKLVIRDDDKIETVKKRLEKDRQQTSPVLDYYRKFNLLIEFQGTRSDEIYPRIKKYLEDKVFK